VSRVRVRYRSLLLLLITRVSGLQLDDNRKGHRVHDRHVQVAPDVHDRIRRKRISSHHDRGGRDGKLRVGKL
jgi:hypothetical protein